MSKTDSDPTRYLLEDVREATEGKYTSEQLASVLGECGYKTFPKNGINDEGFRKLINRLAEVDNKEARLVRVERKDLGSEVKRKVNRASPIKERMRRIVDKVGTEIYEGLTYFPD
jgi:hypothetical protein